jgi:hypothetical protein
MNSGSGRIGRGEPLSGEAALVALNPVGYFGVKAHIAGRALVAPRNATMRSTPFQGFVARRGRNGLFHRGTGDTVPRVAIVKLASCVE